MKDAGHGGFPGSVSGKMATDKKPTVIKKYANRRLYHTGTSTYVTLEDLAGMVRKGEDFVVYDAKSGEEITRSVLAQIIFEQENKEGPNLLPVTVLRQLIRFYGDSMQAVEADQLAEHGDGKEVRPLLVFLLEDNLRQDRAGDLLARLRVIDHEILTLAHHAGQIFQRHVGGSARMVEAAVGIFLDDRRFLVRR